MKGIRSICVLSVVFSLALQSVDAGSVLAGELEGNNSVSGYTLTLPDLSCRTKVEFYLPMIPDTHRLSFGAAPRVGIYYGTGNVSFGLKIPMSIVTWNDDFARTNDLSTSYYLGNLVLDFTARYCIESEFKLCFGGALSLGLGLFEGGSDFDSYYSPEGNERLSSLYYGVLMSQDPVQYVGDFLIFSPAFVLAFEWEGVFSELEFGADIGPAILNGEDYDGMYAAVSYGVAIGYNIGYVSPILEIHGFSAIHDIEDWWEGDSLLWFNAGLQFNIDRIVPRIRISYPITDRAGHEGTDYCIDLGIVYYF
jgi:hypothetical protein